jgi:hypothetical protein
MKMDDERTPSAEGDGAAGRILSADNEGETTTPKARRAQPRRALLQRHPVRRSAHALEHYLLTIAARGRLNYHAYLMCADKRHTEGAASRMMKQMEDNRLTYLPMVLVTRLDDSGVEAVRRIACRQSDEVKGLIARATDFHFSAWLMPDGDPDDAQLMKLH